MSEHAILFNVFIIGAIISASASYDIRHPDRADYSMGWACLIGGIWHLVLYIME